MTEQAIAPGYLLAGKYRIDRVLGAGAMGMVLAATNLGLACRVAIKLMHAGTGAKRAELEERFLREARIAAMLRSEHTAKVLDLGVTDGGAPFIVMEFLDGQDLGAVLETRGPLPVQEAAAYTLQACEALAEAHAAGIVHRDIKPANLFLTRNADGPCVKIVDFGIAKHQAGLGLTRTTAALGSPLYMSPEQMATSREVDGRADVWSLAVTVYQLLTNRLPFEADSLPALSELLHHAPPVPVAQHRPDLPPDLAAAVMQALEKDRARRPDVAAFASVIAPHAPPRSWIHLERIYGSRRLLGAQREAAAGASGPAAVQQTATAPRKGSSLALVALAMLGGALLAVGGVTLASRRSSSGAAAEVPVADTTTSAATVVSAAPPEVTTTAPLPASGTSTALPTAGASAPAPRSLSSHRKPPPTVAPKLPRSGSYDR